MLDTGRKNESITNIPLYDIQVHSTSLFTKFVNVHINIKEDTLITTDVTLLSTQKNVSDLRAYCSENLRIISTDLSDGSAEKKNHRT